MGDHVGRPSCLRLLSLTTFTIAYLPIKYISSKADVFARPLLYNPQHARDGVPLRGATPTLERTEGLAARSGSWRRVAGRSHNGFQRRGTLCMCWYRGMGRAGPSN